NGPGRTTIHRVEAFLQNSPRLESRGRFREISEISAPPSCFGNPRQCELGRQQTRLRRRLPETEMGRDADTAHFARSRAARSWMAGDSSDLPIERLAEKRNAGEVIKRSIRAIIRQ